MQSTTYETTPLTGPLAGLSAADLVARCGRHGAGESWDEFLHRYGATLAATVRRILGGLGRVLARDLHEDLLQEIYCHLLADGRRRLKVCRGTDDRAVAGYLCRLAENVVMDHMRRSNAAKRGRHLLLAAQPTDQTPAVERAVDPDACAERRLLVAESRRLFLARAGGALRGANRRRDLSITYLALFEGWRSREIARRFAGTTANNVDSIVHRTRLKLERAGIDLEALAGRR
jgi:DNA-directed RNA polymerase specialized sigma24 family protein